MIAEFAEIKPDDNERVKNSMLFDRRCEGIVSRVLPRKNLGAITGETGRSVRVLFQRQVNDTLYDPTKVT